MDSCGSADGDGQAGAGRLDDGLHDRRVSRPSRPEQIGAAAPLITSAKWAIWFASGSLRSSATVVEVKGSHHDRGPG